MLPPPGEGSGERGANIRGLLTTSPSPRKTTLKGKAPFRQKLTRRLTSQAPRRAPKTRETQRPAAAVVAAAPGNANSG